MGLPLRVGLGSATGAGAWAVDGIEGVWALDAAAAGSGSAGLADCAASGLPRCGADAASGGVAEVGLTGTGTGTGAGIGGCGMGGAALVMAAGAGVARIIGFVGGAGAGAGPAAWGSRCGAALPWFSDLPRGSCGRATGVVASGALSAARADSGGRLSSLSDAPSLARGSGDRPAAAGGAVCAGTGLGAATDVAADGVARPVGAGPALRSFASSRASA